MKNIIMTLIIVTHAGLALAQKTGNGGDAVVKGEQVSLLDLVENQNEFLSVDGFAISMRGQLAISKIGRIITSPKSITWILTKQALPNVPDEGFLDYNETDAEIRQLAIQKDNVVLIDKNLYERLPSSHQTGLILHELLINTALKVGKNLSTEQGTQNIRKITAALMSESAAQIPADYVIKIWDSIPNHPGTVSALNINRIRSYTYGYPTYITNISIENPVVEINGAFYPIFFSGPHDESGLRLAASDVCKYSGIDNWQFALTTSLEKKTVVAEFKDGSLKLKTAGPGQQIIKRAACKINMFYFM